jgi:hypothetical protein
MRWWLRVKLAQNYSIFSRLLLSTADDPIVEESRKDVFWGAKPHSEHKRVGMNVLGRLLMELRKDLREGDPQKPLTVSPLEIPDFTASRWRPSNRLALLILAQHSQYLQPRLIPSRLALPRPMPQLKK